MPKHAHATPTEADHSAAVVAIDEAIERTRAFPSADAVEAVLGAAADHFGIPSAQGRPLEARKLLGACRFNP